MSEERGHLASIGRLLVSWLTAMILAGCVTWGFGAFVCKTWDVIELYIALTGIFSAGVYGFWQWRRGQRFGRTAFLCVGVAFGTWLLMFTTADNLFGALDRGKQKRTMTDMRVIAKTIEDQHSS